MVAPMFSFRAWTTAFGYPFEWRRYITTIHGTGPGKSEDRGSLQIQLALHIATSNGDVAADVLFQGVDNAFGYPSNGDGNIPQYMKGDQENLKHGGPFQSSWRSHRGLQRRCRADVLFQGVTNRFWLSLSNGDGTFHNM